MKQKDCRSPALQSGRDRGQADLRCKDRNLYLESNGVEIILELLDALLQPCDACGLLQRELRLMRDKGLQWLAGGFARLPHLCAILKGYTSEILANKRS